MFRGAREQVGLSQEQASFVLHIGRRTLSDYENSHTLTPPDVVLKMSEEYRNPELCARYCAEYCPIGQKNAHPVETKELAAAVLGLIKEYNDVHLIRDRLICIAADGVISLDEAGEFEVIMAELEQLEQKIMALRLWGASKMGMSLLRERKPKEKGLGIFAESRAEYNAY